MGASGKGWDPKNTRREFTARGAQTPGTTHVAPRSFGSAVELLAGAFHLAQDAKGVFAEDLADVSFGIAFLQKCLGDLRELGGVFHANGHVSAVEVGTEADVIYARELHGVVNVLDDLCPIHFRKSVGVLKFAEDLIADGEGATFVVPTAFFDLGFNGFSRFWIGFFGVAEFLAEKADVIVDLDDAAVFAKVSNHVVGHIARSIADG